jgi:hypothetical protein
MASLNLAVRFLVELAAVVWVGWWGTTVSTETAPRVIAAAAAVAVFAVVWGRFLAPTAKSGLSRRRKEVAGTVVLLLAAAALAVAGQPLLALAYAVLVLVNAAWILANEEAVAGAVERMGPRA